MVMRTEHEKSNLRVMIVALAAITLFVCGGAAASIRTASNDASEKAPLVDPAIIAIATEPPSNVLGAQTGPDEIEWEGQVIREQMRRLLEEGKFGKTRE